MTDTQAILNAHAAALDARLEATKQRHAAIIAECVEELAANLRRDLQPFYDRHAHRVAATQLED